MARLNTSSRPSPSKSPTRRLGARYSEVLIHSQGPRASREMYQLVPFVRSTSVLPLPSKSPKSRSVMGVVSLRRACHQTRPLEAKYQTLPALTKTSVPGRPSNCAEAQVLMRSLAPIRKRQSAHAGARVEPLLAGGQQHVVLAVGVEVAHPHVPPALGVEGVAAGVEVELLVVLAACRYRSSPSSARPPRRGRRARPRCRGSMCPSTVRPRSIKAGRVLKPSEV